MAKITEEVKKFVEEEFQKPEACFKESFENHFEIVVKYAKGLAKIRNADEEIVEIAAWLHDMGSIRGNYKNHHVISSKIAEQLLTKLNYPKEKIEQVKHCILSHRASKQVKRETKEAQILADADSLAHFNDIKGILERVFKNDKEKTLAKLERAYSKLSDDAKSSVKDKLERARKELT